MVVASLYTKTTSKKQISEVERRIIKDGYELLDEDKFVGRGGLESLLYKVTKGHIDRVYIFSPDHLSEEFAKQVKVVREFHRAGTEVIFLKHRTKGLISSLLWKSQWAMEKYKYAMEWQIG